MTGRAAACWELPDVRRGGRLSGRSRRFSAGCHGFSILEKRALTQIQNTLADSRFAGPGSTFSSRILDLQVRGVRFHRGFSICRSGESIQQNKVRFFSRTGPCTNSGCDINCHWESGVSTPPHSAPSRADIPRWPLLRPRIPTGDNSTIQNFPRCVSRSPCRPDNGRL